METSAPVAPPRPVSRIRRVPWERALWPAATGCLMAVIYVSSLLPGMGYSGDTARFQFVGATLSTPHTTGYPLYVLVN
ncbi:MAG TPA: hypothetical protein VIO14_00045, partial [Dehalococcoidia bacterium]